jgi:transcriptional regulator of acetoin/glycerol metabolism
MTLRDRRCDLGLVIQALLAGSGFRHASFTPTAALALFSYPWPFNIRELEHALIVAATIAPDQRIDLMHLPEAIRTSAAADRPAAGTPAVTAVDTPAVPPSADAAFAPQLSAKDRSLRHKLEGLLADNGHNLAALARALGKDRTQIYRWVRRLGISRGTRK